MRIIESLVYFGICFCYGYYIFCSFDVICKFIFSLFYCGISLSFGVLFCLVCCCFSFNFDFVGGIFSKLFCFFEVGFGVSFDFVCSSVGSLLFGFVFNGGFDDFSCMEML